MGYHAERTPVLIASLQNDPGREFTASELKDRTGVPKKFVRRTLTVDAEKVARVPMDGVAMVKKGGHWRFSWNAGASAQPPSRRT